MLSVTTTDSTYLEIKCNTNKAFYIFNYKILCLIPRLSQAIPTEEIVSTEQKNFDINNVDSKVWA